MPALSREAITKQSLLVAAGIASSHEHPFAIVIHDGHPAEETVEDEPSKAHTKLKKSTTTLYNTHMRARHTTLHYS